MHLLNLVWVYVNGTEYRGQIKWCTVLPDSYRFIASQPFLDIIT